MVFISVYLVYFSMYNFSCSYRSTLFIVFHPIEPQNHLSKYLPSQFLKAEIVLQKFSFSYYEELLILYCDEIIESSEIDFL